ncbi:MAG: sensor histidine kinase [Pirellulales bacterium]
MSENLRFFTSRKHPVWAPIDIAEVVQESLDRIREYQTRRNVRVHCDPLTSVFAYGDQEWITMAVTNILENAVEHTPRESHYRVTVEVDSRKIRILVEDQGPGITPGSEYQIFKPFYTTQPGATGLGLANVRRVIEIHGGGIQVTNMEHGGALFTLKLPRIQAQQAA